MEVSAQLYVSAILPYRKEPRYPLNRKLEGPRTVLDILKGKLLPL